MIKPPGWDVEESIILEMTHIFINHKWGIIRTAYPDETYQELSLAYIPEDEAIGYARILGYDNSWGHYREHEIVHTWLALMMGFPYSPTLWTVAHLSNGLRTYGEVTRKAQGMEEWLVTEFQKYVNTGEITVPLHWLEDRGHDLDYLRRLFCGMFRQSK